MAIMTVGSLQALVLVLSVNIAAGTDLPNIVLLVADDMGWNDVSWNNPDMITPNLQWMGDHGVFLNYSYVQPQCSPTRASFLTGRYPYHMGLQRGVVSFNEPKFLSRNYSTLAETLKTKDYSTHLVGKWHLGHCDWSYTPTHRGFDTHNGILLGGNDHYTHASRGGFDFRANEEVDHSFDSVHSTDAYTSLAKTIISNHNTDNPLFLYLAYQAPHSPLQAPQEYVAMYDSLFNDARRTYSAMVTHMDDSIGKIRLALEEKGIMDNTVVVFLSDNGGTGNQGNNFPLRGVKKGIHEGGVRTPALVYSPLLAKTGYRHSGLIHAVDWYSTFLHLAEIPQAADIDGVSQWDMLQNGANSGRTEFVYSIDTDLGLSAIRMGQYKLLQGMKDEDIIPVSTSNTLRQDVDKGHRRVKRAGKWQLFDIEADPSESNDLSSSKRPLLRQMRRRLKELEVSEHPVFDVDRTDAALPRNFGGVWTPQWCVGGL